MNRISLCLLLLILAIVLIGSVYAADETGYSSNKSVVTQESQEKTKISFPDVCETPSPDSPASIPSPYPNTATSSDTTKGSKKVKVDGNPINKKGTNIKSSNGDESGSE